MTSLTYDAETTPSASPPPVSTVGQSVWRRRLASGARHALLIGVALIFTIPFYWMVISAFKPNDQVFSDPIQWWPNSLRWENFTEAANYPGFPFLQFLWNSLFYAGSVTVGTVLSCACVAYGFARLRFPGRDWLFAMTIGTLMVPAIVTLIPTFLLFKTFGMIGSYAPLIVPRFFGDAFFIFMLRQFFMNLPGELADAARVDGADEFRIFWQIMLPLVRPALIVVAVFTFLWTWHEFFGPLIYLSDSNQFPLSLGLFAFHAQRTVEWGLMMAGSVLTTLPLVLVFFIAQKYFIEGIKVTGIKG